MEGASNAPPYFKQKKPSSLSQRYSVSCIINTFLNIDRVPIDEQLYGTYRIRFLLLL